MMFPHFKQIEELHNQGAVYLHERSGKLFVLDRIEDVEFFSFERDPFNAIAVFVEYKDRNHDGKYDDIMQYCVYVSEEHGDLSIDRRDFHTAVIKVSEVWLYGRDEMGRKYEKEECSFSNPIILTIMFPKSIREVENHLETITYGF